MWYQVKIIVDEKGRPRSQAHVDLAILDIVVDQVVQSNQQNIDCWRIHRRYGGHEFKFEVFCLDPTAGQTIQNATADHQLTADLRAANIVCDVQCEPGPHVKEDIGESSWPSEFRHVWPNFAQAQSEMQLNIVKFLRVNSTGSPTIANIMALPRNDRIKFYEIIQGQIDNSWGKQGSHAFMHHLHSFFGYASFQSHLGTSYIIHDIR